MLDTRLNSLLVRKKTVCSAPYELVWGIIVSQYFSKSRQKADLKTAILVPQITAIETIVTQSEKDAFILENQLIKTYQPKYNILLKDDKSYPYIKVTLTETFPRLLVVNAIESHRNWRSHILRISVVKRDKMTPISITENGGFTS